MGQDSFAVFPPPTEYESSLGGDPFCRLVIVEILFAEEDCSSPVTLSLLALPLSVDPFDSNTVEVVKVSLDNNDMCKVDLDKPMRRTPREAATNNF